MDRAIVLAALLACAGSAVADEPEWLKTLRARESAPLPAPVDVASPDGWFSAKATAKLAGKIEFADDAYAVNFELAPDIIASCQVTKDSLDLGSTLNLTAASAFEFLGKQHGKIDFRGVERIDAGQVEGSPFMAVDWVYRVASDKGPLIGSLKQVSANRHGAGIYCVQSDVGYAQSFAALTRSLLQSLQVKDAGSPPEFEDISVASIGGKKVGVMQSSIRKDGADGLRVDMRVSMILPITPDTLRAEDTYSVQFTANDGSMVNAMHVVANNGEIETQLKLDPLEEGGWKVSGQHMGKALDGKIDGTREPATLVSQAHVRKALLAAANPLGAENVEWQWIPADPLQLTESRLKVTAAAGEGLYRARETLGGMVVDTILERATGMAQRADFAIGANTLVAERVYVRGQL